MPRPRLEGFRKGLKRLSGHTLEFGETRGVTIFRAFHRTHVYPLGPAMANPGRVN